jgi:predicted DNA-binding transcriptional regulator AlpA
MEKLLDFPAVAALLDCSRPHVYDLAAAGEFGELVEISAKPGGERTKTRITEAAVQAFIERRKRAIPTAS